MGWIRGEQLRCTECGGYTIVAGYGDRGYQKSWPCPTILLLAAIWSDHPDYDAAWTPEPE